MVVGGSAVDCQSYSDVWDTLTEGVGGWSTTVTLTLGAHYSVRSVRVQYPPAAT